MSNIIVPPRDTIYGEEPKNPITGMWWTKTCMGKFGYGSLNYVFYNDVWNLFYDAGNVSEMILLLSFFGEVKIKQTNPGEFFCCHMPENRGALWYYESKSTLNEALDGLIKKAIKLKVIE